MHQTPLPPEYIGLPDEEYAARIDEIRARMGERLVILGHHYQRDEIIRHADLRGDSYKLAKDASARPQAEFIVFCGVHFMAESADLLAADHQKVILPNLAAGCSMADMANLFQVKNAWRQLAAILGDIELDRAGSDPKVVPVTYINSAANLKGFVGEHGGTVCTSTNAPQALEWALAQGEKVLFFPDQHLGRNTAAAMGFDPDRDMVVWDPFQPNGGHTPDRIREAKFYLWKGHCSVHKRFTVEQIEAARRDYPGVKVLVHPECPIEVVRASDLYGSTEYIINQVRAAAPGTTWAIGTEINLVNRLAKEHPEQTVFCLDPHICPCSTMYRIHPSFLLWTLENLERGNIVNHVVVPEKTAHYARIALQRMLNLGSMPKD
jgi:quinolinate synthase